MMLKMHRVTQVNSCPLLYHERFFFFFLKPVILGWIPSHSRCVFLYMLHIESQYGRYSELQRSVRVFRFAFKFTDGTGLRLGLGLAFSCGGE